MGHTINGGANNGGVLFSIDTNGTSYTDLHDFNVANGEYPYGVVNDGKILYGMAQWGGVNNSGVLYKFKEIGLGVNETHFNNDGVIKVYPNPNNGSFAISLSNVNAACNIEIYNILGEKVYSESGLQNQSKNTVNLSGQPAGVYFYRVLKENGGLVGEGKIVIQH